jgi:hypothetical protein
VVSERRVRVESVQAARRLPLVRPCSCALCARPSFSHSPCLLFAPLDIAPPKSQQPTQQHASSASETQEEEEIESLNRETREQQQPTAAGAHFTLCARARAAPSQCSVGADRAQPTTRKQHNGLHPQRAAGGRS